MATAATAVEEGAAMGAVAMAAMAVVEAGVAAMVATQATGVPILRKATIPVPLRIIRMGRTIWIYWSHPPMPSLVALPSTVLL